MKRFVVKKNTLPYVYQYAVIDTKTGNKISEHTTPRLAEESCIIYEQCGLPDPADSVARNSKNALENVSERMKRPDGDPLQKPRHSGKRRVQLD